MDIYEAFDDFFKFLNEFTEDTEQLSTVKLGSFKRRNSYKTHIKPFLDQELILSNINESLIHIIGCYDNDNISESLTDCINNIKTNKFNYIDDSITDYLSTHPSFSSQFNDNVNTVVDNF